MNVKFGQAGFGSSLGTALCQKSHTIVPEEADHQTRLCCLWSTIC